MRDQDKEVELKPKLKIGEMVRYKLRESATHSQVGKIREIRLTSSGVSYMFIGEDDGYWIDESCIVARLVEQPL